MFLLSKRSSACYLHWMPSTTFIQGLDEDDADSFIIRAACHWGCFAIVLSVCKVTLLLKYIAGLFCSSEKKNSDKSEKARSRVAHHMHSGLCRLLRVKLEGKVLFQMTGLNNLTTGSLDNLQSETGLRQVVGFKFVIL